MIFCERLFGEIELKFQESGCLYFSMIRQSYV